MLFCMVTSSSLVPFSCSFLLLALSPYPQNQNVIHRLWRLVHKCGVQHLLHRARPLLYSGP